ncbi:MAG TPA: HD domain-containing phosphohydrolase, partial [Solirubrobacterales bacterium]|nr:HD domain-containing phosphohydrolase [Solirubrobacterales bacterium]
IPIEGRIAAVADVFDALTSDRVYRPAMPVEKALSIMEEGRDSHFDPLVLDTFFESVNEVLAIRDGRFVEDVKEEQERRRQGRRRRRKVSRGVNASSNGEAVVAMRPASVDVDPRPDDSTDDSGDARQSLVG